VCRYETSCTPGEDARFGCVSGESGGERREFFGAHVGERCGEARQPVPVEERGVDVAREERLVAQHVHEQVAIRAYAVQRGASERGSEQAGRIGTSRRPADHFCEHGVVMNADDAAVLDTAVESDAAGR
jgi:hypothetical protein